MGCFVGVLSAMAWFRAGFVLVEWPPREKVGMRAPGDAPWDHARDLT